jgi:hypothetical protein
MILLSIILRLSSPLSPYFVHIYMILISILLSSAQSPIFHDGQAY